MASKLAAAIVVLTAALMSPSCTALHAEGIDAAAYDEAAALEYVPVRRPRAAAMIVPDAAGTHTERYCDRHLCCTRDKPYMCLNMQCCMERTCSPGQPCSAPKAIACGCNNNLCV